MRYKNFTKSEQKILSGIQKAYLKGGIFSLTLKNVAVEARMTESTLYRHCSQIELLIDKYRDMVFDDFELVYNKEYSLEIFFQRFLISLYKNREAMKVLILVDGVRGIEDTMKIIRPVIINEWPNYNRKRTSVIFRYCEWMMAGEILNWKSERFDKRQIETRARHMVWIAMNTPKVYNRMTVGETGE